MQRGGASVILGLSFDFHDSAAALIIDGEIVAACEQERFSRVKHDGGIPTQAVDSCLRIAGLGADDVDVVAFYEKPLTVLSRYLAVRQRQGPAGLGTFASDVPRLLRHNLFTGYRIDRMMRALGAGRSVPVRYIDHHRSHAAAAFLPSPFEHAAVLTIDGIGEWATASIGRGAHHNVELLEELRYPDSLGLLYSWVTDYLGFVPNCDESKVMGLAPYGTAVFSDALSELAPIELDGSMRIRADQLRWYSPRAKRRASLHRLLGGPPRDPGAPIEQRHADLAASVQSLTESAVLAMAARAKRLTGEARLCLSGGVALNCVANGRVQRESAFEDVWIQPASGDAGSALGAALSLWHTDLGHHRRTPSGDSMSGAFLGPRALTAEVDDWIRSESISTTRYDTLDDLVDAVAARLDGGEIVGWVQGAMEFGPRALGHRSILADPRSPTVRHRLNSAVKGREDFRPFAPAVLATHATEWFSSPTESPYMLTTANVASTHLIDVAHEPATIDERAELARSAIPACTHVDGSARVQTVDSAANPELAALLVAFHRRTGVPLLLNTSFNRGGEAIVATPIDAVRTADRAGLDFLVIDHHLVERQSLERASSPIDEIQWSQFPPAPTDPLPGRNRWTTIGTLVAAGFVASVATSGVLRIGATAACLLAVAIHLVPGEWALSRFATRWSTAFDSWITRIVDAVVHVLLIVVGLPVIVLPWLLGRSTLGSPLGPSPTGLEMGGAPPVAGRFGARMWDRDPRQVRTNARRRIHRVVAVVATLAVVGSIAGLSARFAQDRATRSKYDLAALHDSPWAVDVQLAADSAFARGEFTSFNGVVLPETHSEWLNVTADGRQTWTPPASACEPVPIWFFGGSAGFGLGQRDDGTIASWLARLAWDEGLPLAIQNRAVPADTHWMEVRRFESAVAAGSTPPAIALFYDGVNDLDVQSYLNSNGLGGALLFASYPDGEELADISADRERLAILNDFLTDGPTTKTVAHPPLAPDDLAAFAATGYRSAGVTGALLTTTYDVDRLWFYQPSRVSRSTPVSGEDEKDPDNGPWRHDLELEFRRLLPPEAIDLSDAIDGESSPIYYDWVHTNERGAKLVAEAMLDHLRPLVQTQLTLTGGSTCR